MKIFFKVQLMLKLLSSFVLFTAFVFPQEIDSLLNQNTQTIPDTNFVQIDDTTAISDSILTTKVKSDTLSPIQGMPLTDVSTIINKRTFLFDQYRYTGDLLRSFSLNFVKDYGFIGYPNETFIYGVGNSGISYLQDGVFWNDRYTNPLDLNLIQSENIDSIEIVPSPRGFLYGPYNNPVTVNFITRDFIPPVPYARIRYYEGPDGEAMIDGKFSAMVAKRWNYSFQLTNRSKDETYKNTELSLWQFNTKLKYLLSNSINFQVFYYFVDKEQGLNGGVDYDSLRRSSDDPNADLYNPIAAPVFYPNLKLDILQHNVGLRALVKPFDGSQLDLSIYYRYGLDDRSNSRDSFYFKIDTEIKLYGYNINYSHNLGILTFQLLGDYENLDNALNWVYDNYIDKFTYDRFSFGGLVTARFLNNIIQPSVFYKQNHLGDENINIDAVGTDVLFSLAENQKLYIGYSLRENIYDDEKIPSLEIGTLYKSSQILFDLKYFSNKYYYETSEEAGLGFKSQNMKGLGLIFNYKYWLLLLETNTSYYFKVENQYHPDFSEHPYDFPEWQFIGGLYVNDIFFDNNLNLKAGFKFYYTSQIYLATRYSSAEGIYQPTIEPTSKLDFNLAGEIQKVAFFYFQWENLFGNEYYITPYYPMPVRNIKFGIAWELFN
jgi:Putative porin/TonB-dependent Receptor Plug Domain